MDRIRQLRGIEKTELLLVPQHFERRLPEHCKVECRTVNRCIGEHDLVGQRRLTGSGRPRENVERELWEAASQYLVQSRHTGRQSMDRDLAVVAHCVCSLALSSIFVSGATAGQTSATIRLVSCTPTSFVSNSSMFASKTVLPLITAAGSRSEAASAKPSRDPSSRTRTGASQATSCRDSARARAHND